MSKQTAVEWLVKQIECFGNNYELQMSWATLDELCEQAKEMEKQQIIGAYEDVSTKDGEFLTGEQYYNETYGK
jgi:hypothetical protein